MDYAISLFLGLVLLVSGAGVAYISYRAASGALGRNKMAGIRIPSTMRSDEAWLAGHRAAFWPSVFGSGQAMFGGLLLLFGPGPESTTLIVLVVSGVLVASMAVATIMASSAANGVDSPG